MFNRLTSLRNRITEAALAFSGKFHVNPLLVVFVTNGVKKSDGALMIL